MLGTKQQRYGTQEDQGPVEEVRQPPTTDEVGTVTREIRLWKRGEFPCEVLNYQDEIRETVPDP